MLPMSRVHIKLFKWKNDVLNRVTYGERVARQFAPGSFLYKLMAALLFSKGSGHIDCTTAIDDPKVDVFSSNLLPAVPNHEVSTCDKHHGSGQILSFWVSFIALSNVQQ